MKARRHLLTGTIQQVLQSGKSHPKGRCSLPRPLYGSARVQLLNQLDRHSLVWITYWGTGRACGLEIGSITSVGEEALRDGSYL